MKKKYLLIEFIAVFLLLILPPFFFSTQDKASVSVKVSFSLLIQLLIALFLDFQTRKFFPDKNPDSKAVKLIHYFTYSSFTFGFLAFIYVFFQLLAIFNPGLLVEYNDIQITKSFSGILSLAAVCLCGAYYEEILYRQYLPETLQILFPKDGLKLPFEILSVLIFAFSHLYLGLLGFLNALLCGIILRICKVKTKSVYTGAVVHFLYNFLMFLTFVK